MLSYGCGVPSPHPQIISILDILAPPNLEHFEDVYIVSDLMETDLHRIIYSRYCRRMDGWMDGWMVWGMRGKGRKRGRQRPARDISWMCGGTMELLEETDLHRIIYSR